jgi:hypothetical protein
MDSIPVNSTRLLGWSSSKKSVAVGTNESRVHNQFSGSEEAKIDLIDYLFEPSSYVYMHNPDPLRLAFSFEEQIDLIDSISGRVILTYRRNLTMLPLNIKALV